MRKYWNALRYGNAKTKRILITAILLGILAVTGGILAAAGNGAIWGLIAAFAALMDIVLIQSVRFGEVEIRTKENKAKDDIGEKKFEGITEISEEDIKQLLIKYKVKKERVPVVIDSYEKEKVKQSPAYLWRDRGYLQFLVLEEKPRNLAVPLSKADKITYLKNVEIDPKKEYEQLRKPSVVNALFQEYLPVYSERQKNGRKVFTKNLYTIGQGINITNTSVKNANQVLQLPISFEGIVDSRFSYYYQEAYRMKILLMDQVLSAEEYKEQVSFLLKQMADGDEDFEEFADDLELMVRARLVTREVADYYMDYRQKQKKKKK